MLKSKNNFFFMRWFFGSDAAHLDEPPLIIFTLTIIDELLTL